MLKIDADMLKRNPPQLYPGEVMPSRSVYWLVWILDRNTGRPYHSRVTNDKWMTPVEAAQQCYGIVPTTAMRFFNLGTSASGMRKRIKEVARLYDAALKAPVTPIED